MTEVDVIEAGDGVRASAAALRAEGRSVTYLGATLIAADEVVVHAFHASDRAAVEAVSQAAGLVFERIVESVAVGIDEAAAIPPSR